MIRILVLLVLLAAIALGIAWVADQPGEIVATWRDLHADMEIGTGIGIVFLAAVVLNIVWAVIRFVFKIPSLLSLAAQARRRAKGFAALTRGMIAAGAGDARTARKSAAEAKKHLRDEPLATLLSAQAAQLSGDRIRAEAAFGQLAERQETRLLGLRGLHVEAQRRGDHDAAHYFAHEAHAVAPLPWSAKAVLDHHTANEHWEAALAALESHIDAKLVDRKTAERQRAVLETAIALDKATRAPEEALRLAQAALKQAPDLVPALALAARLLARKGDLRKAAKLIENAWPRCPHPDLAAVYLDLRPGDSNVDRLAKAQILMRLLPREPESRLALARAALAARRFDIARDAMAPLIAEDERPTAGMCLLMAELENAEHGDHGQVRQWMARASRAPRDAVWMADGVAAAQWAPVSPVTGRLDAFVWQRPPDRLGAEITHQPSPDWTIGWVQGPEGHQDGHQHGHQEGLTAPIELPAPAEEAKPVQAAEPAEPPIVQLGYVKDFDEDRGHQVDMPAAGEPLKERAQETLRPAAHDLHPETARDGLNEPAKEMSKDIAPPKPAAKPGEAAAPKPVRVPEPLQKVVFPLPGAPDDPGLEEPEPPNKERIGYF